MAPAALWTLAHSVLTQTPPLPELEEVLVLVIGAVLAAVCFLAALFFLLALAGRMPYAPKGALWAGLLNIFPGMFWAYAAVRFEWIFGVFAFAQLMLAMVTTAAGYRATAQQRAD